MIDNEQWKSEGNCEICRRKSYCKKSCDRAVRREIGRAIVNASGKIMGAYIAASAISAVSNEHNFEVKDGGNDEMQ